jgi:hypothetical protein
MSTEFTASISLVSTSSLENGLNWSADQTLLQKSVFDGGAQKPMCMYYADVQILIFKPDLICWILSIKIKSCA